MSSVVLPLDKVSFNCRPLGGGLRMCYCADVACGKTLGGVKECARFAVNYPELPVYSNVDLNETERGRDLFSNFRSITRARQLIDINHPCCLFLDETGWLGDGDNPNSVANKFLLIVLLRSSKKGWKVIFTVQYYTQLLKKVRSITSLWIVPFMRGAVLVEQIYTKTGIHLRDRGIDARPFGELYNSNADILTLDIDDIKAEYALYRKKRGMVSVEDE